VITRDNEILNEKGIKKIAQTILDSLAYNVEPRGLEVMEDRGYTATMVVYSMIRDILEAGENLGMDPIHLVKKALEQHSIYCDDHHRILEASRSI
jgi:hypothetical protein